MHCLQLLKRDLRKRSAIPSVAKAIATSSNPMSLTIR